MFSEEVKAYPLCAWLLSAMSAALAIAAAGCDPAVLLPVTLGCGILCWCVFVLSEGACCKKKWYCGVQLVWLVVAVAAAANRSGMCWSDAADDPAVPLTLLLIAGASAWNGAERASRVSAVVFWLLAFLYAVVLVSGVGNIEPKWLVPAVSGCSPLLLMTLLIPVVITFLPRQGARCYTPTLICTGIFGLVLSVCTVGTLSPQVADSVAFPFYEFSKSMDLFGVAERFEAIVSVALTMGCYSLQSLLLCACASLAENIHPGRGKTAVLACAVSGAALMGVIDRLPAWFFGCGALIMWGVLPLIGHTPTKVKKSKKVEKRA